MTEDWRFMRDDWLVKIKHLKEEEIVVVKTDKSHKFAVINSETYKVMSQKQTDKDRNISWEEVVVKLRSVNN